MVIFKDTRVSKREEQEGIVQVESHDVIATAKMWWDELHDWRAAFDG